MSLLAMAMGRFLLLLGGEILVAVGHGEALVVVGCG